MDESIISYATKNNWKRLNVKDSDIEYRLSKRANKRFSTKSIIPVEYFSDTSNLSILNLILDYEQFRASIVFNIFMSSSVSFTP